MMNYRESDYNKARSQEFERTCKSCKREFKTTSLRDEACLMLGFANSVCDACVNKLSKKR